ncbi:hypothetical protein R6Q59_019005 [Mikania micrantha]
METLKSPETLIESLVASKQDENKNLFGGICSGVSQSFNLGKMKCVESCIDPCNAKGFDRVDSISHGDVPMKGISLFVELTGEMTNKPDGENIRDVKSCLLYENRVKVDVGQPESEVVVGDIVWVIITKQKQLWWPGIVCDAANAPKEAANRPMREDDVLVRCFGNGNYIWCSSYEMKPFVGYFDQLPNQSKAKKFLDALDKALTELGHRARAEFTCPCFSKMKLEKTGRLGDLSVTRFEPAKFLEYIKDLGKDISMPHEIDYVVKQNCLSAFYRSLGHLQIPMNQLKPTNGFPLKIKTEQDNGYFEDIERSCETRDRRKSRFLSYPGECGIEESKVDALEGVDFNKACGQSQPVKKIQKKSSRENKGVPANLCSSEVLSQLQFAAKDCVFQCEIKNFDPVERFISGFRKWAFNEFPSEILFEVRKKDKFAFSPALGNNLDHGSLILDFKNVRSLNLEAHSMANQDTIFKFGDQQLTRPPPCKLEPRRRNKVAEKITSMPTCNADISTLPNVNHTDGIFQSALFDFTNIYGSAPTSFAGNHGELQAGLVTTGLSHGLKKRGRKRKNIDFQANPGSTMDQLANAGSTIDLQANFGSTKNLKTNPGSIPSYFTGNNDEPEAGLAPTDLSHVPKKRGRKKKNKDSQSNSGSAPPYFTGNQPQAGLIPTMYLPANTGSIPPYFTGDHSQAGLVPTMYLQANPGSISSYFTGNPQQAGLVSTMYLQANPGSTPPYFTGNYGEPQVGLVPNGLSHVPKKRGRKRKNIDLQANPGSTIDLPANPGSIIDLPANPGSTIDLHSNPGSTVIPNLNANICGQKKQNRTKRSKEIGVPCIDLSYNKVQQDDFEAKGTAFLLKFSPDYPLPSNQDLNSAFSKFGELIESETQVSNENLSGQVVFLDSSCAGEAFWCLQNDKPFGLALVNYKIQHLLGSESKVPFKTPIKSPSGPNPMDSKAIITPAIIPDLIPNSSEIQVLKSKAIEEIRLPPSNDNHLSYSKVHQGVEEATGTALLLKFSPNHPLPRVQDLNSLFCKHGELNESETRVSVLDFTGQVVFVNPSAAGDAIYRLEKDQPFGQALLSYRVHHLYSVQSVVQVKSPVNVCLDLKPPQDLGVVKQNLEMMNLMLEKSGDSLSPEMRGKLESEIKGLMNKVRAMDGSSSSSCL